ncbi:PqiC family protein [Motilimonas pumila]|uniref:Membrane integrity-associated transporter subunit PqiC n=1 Tax=Motilimonas pumila TaxID=2303987 RepID=A0A418YD43_9GAMM|nr:ABC-type transport auxiliary lipoprotein family protein [Motilimonas pumila]RJG42434.1 membrane integrity-associated transporter subunit PqiC [Motilimonas pumila]
MMKSLIRRVLLAAAGITLMACSNNQSAIETYYYALGADDLAVSAIDNQGQGTLVVKPVELSDYLNSSGVVMQMTDNQIHIAEQHLWAGNLNQQLDSLGQEALTLHLPQWSIIESTDFYPNEGDKYWILAINVNRFQGRLEGSAVVSGRWSLVNPDGVVVKDELFNHQLNIPRGDYSDLVEKLKQNWLNLHRAIAQQVVNSSK